MKQINFLGQKVKFEIAHKIEMFLLFAFAILLLWWDVLQNKVIDLGKDYQVTWWGNTTTSALDLAVIILIAFHFILLILFLINLGRGNWKMKTADVTIGIIATFGVAILLSGFVNSLYSENIRFLFIDMKSITFYHIGVLFELIAGIYWAFTK